MRRPLAASTTGSPQGAQGNALNERAARSPRLDRHRTHHRQLRAPLCHVLVLESIPVIGLFPSLAPRSLKRAQQAPKRIIIATHACQVAGRPANELWCFDTRVSQRNTPTTKEDIGRYLQDLAVTLQLDELLLAQPELLCEGDLPTDHLFAGRNVIAMRQAATKESRRRR